MSLGLCEAAPDLGINVYTVYGMSETCPVLILANLKPKMLLWEKDEQIKIRCKTGLPIPNVHIEIVDDKGKILPQDGDSTGEVVVRAP